MARGRPSSSTPHPLLWAAAATAAMGCSTEREGRSASARPGDETVKARPYDDAPAKSADGLVETRRATEIGVTGATLAGAANPKGRPARYYFEYGPTTAYGQRTREEPVPPKLAAHYYEGWSRGLSNWAGGFSGTDLVHVPQGGVKDAHVRFVEPSAIDQNHVDGIGSNQLVQYMWMGSYVPNISESAFFGGGEPDLRDAKIRVHVRGNQWRAEGSELVFWTQTDLDLDKQQDDNKAVRANWAYTGVDLTSALFTGKWELLEYRIVDDPNLWTYGGSFVDDLRKRYAYQPLDTALRNANNDVFHMLVFVNPLLAPTGTIDFDEIEITYRNHSVVFPSNGGKLVSLPPGSEDGARLTDGWRNGPDHTWATGPNPVGPQDIVYELASPVTIDAVQIHQNPDHPSKEIEVHVSEDGTNWTLLSGGPKRPAVLREKSPAGPNYDFWVDTLRARTVEAVEEGAPFFPIVKARFVRVRILSGYRPDRWGLGEIEIFGEGAKDWATEDEPCSFSADVSGLTPGTTYHYRLVMVTADGVTAGGDKTFEVPKDARPSVFTRLASRLGGGSAKVEARVAPMGYRTRYYFTYREADGTEVKRTEDEDAGLELGPRTVVTKLTGLVPGKTYLYAVVASNDQGTSFGEELSFVAK